MMGSVLKAIETHKDETANHFDRVHKKVDLNKVNVDLAPVLNGIETMGGHFDRLHKKIDASKVEVDHTPLLSAMEALSCNMDG